jgi:hypothetical protein
VIPDTFTILLEFGEDTVCGGAPFSYEYQVTISGDTISLLQIYAGITTSDPYTSAAGEFATTLSGMPGTETYAGMLAVS